MKSRINYGKNSDNSDGIILSIGMIVKNEEKVLRRCLESLKPLMEAIPSELIIADTGSTDSTFDIAREYTDNVFHFEWINNFAAARNSTLKKARGLWYMFVDADEYLDTDIHEIIEFFQIPELYNSYKTAQLIVRSYTNKSLSEYSDCHIPRFHRIKNNDPDEIVEFVGIVHETIYMRQPLGYFQTILHHTGYIYDSELQHKNKKERNIVLMREEYKSNPDKLRTISELLDGCNYYPEEAEKYIEDARELLKNDRQNLYGNVVYMQSIFHYQNRNPEYALMLCDEYYKNNNDCDTFLATLAVVMMKAEILAALGRYDEAYESYKKYFWFYDENKKGNLNIRDSSAHMIYGLHISEYMKSIYAAEVCLKNLRRYDEAFEILEKFNYEKIIDSEFTTFLAALRDIGKASKNYKKIAEYYYKITQMNNPNKSALVLYMMESIFYSLISTDERMEFARKIVESGFSGKYIELMRLFISQDDPAFIEKLDEFVKQIDDWENGYLEAVYLSIKYKLDISSSVNKMKSAYVREKIESIAVTHDDFAGYVLAYGIPDSFLGNIKQFNWIVSLYEKASYRSFNLNDKEKYEMYYRFTSLLGDYVFNIYNPELLNDDDIEVLPDLHKFGYFMAKAHKALASEDNIGYIRFLKEALVHCESMKEIVQFMLEYFKKMFGLN